MPIHDWSRVPAWLFHDFHQSWSIRVKDALNAGRLSKGLAALVGQTPALGSGRGRVIVREARTSSVVFEAKKVAAPRIVA